MKRPVGVGWSASGGFSRLVIMNGLECMGFQPCREACPKDFGVVKQVSPTDKSGGNSYDQTKSNGIE